MIKDRIQHSPEYSTPAYLKFPAPQAAAQSATVIAPAPPATAIPVVRARPFVPSLATGNGQLVWI
jgi:hypothetical protein